MIPKIVFEDNHIIVAIKPPNVPSQEDSSGDPDMLSLLKSYIKEKYSKPGKVFLGLLHRLDRPAQGIMVFARTSKAAARLSKQISEHTFKKSYLAIVNKSVSAATLVDYMIKDTQKNISRVVSKDYPEAKKAELSFSPINTVDELTLLDISLKTGRPHQIRVQLSGIGAPILGDKKYGGAESKNLCLLAKKIEFTHPTTKEFMSFETDIPSEYPWNLF